MGKLRNLTFSIFFLLKLKHTFKINWLKGDKEKVIIVNKIKRNIIKGIKRLNFKGYQKGLYFKHVY